MTSEPRVRTQEKPPYYRVFVGEVLVWGWATHIDGPLSDDAASLFRALTDWCGTDTVEGVRQGQERADP